MSEVKLTTAERTALGIFALCASSTKFINEPYAVIYYRGTALMGAPCGIVGGERFRLSTFGRLIALKLIEVGRPTRIAGASNFCWITDLGRSVHCAGRRKRR